MVKAKIAFAILGCLLADLPQATAQAAEIMPMQLQRALSKMHDKAIRGDTTAEGNVRELLLQIGQQFEVLDPQVWRSHSSAVAASVFLFSGGVSAHIRRVLARGYFRPSDRSLIEAALSFAEGRPAMARQQLAEFDPETVDPVLSGPLALVRGSLEMENDLEAARKFFDWARLSAPGSIFEEAALRRQAIIFADLKQLDSYIRTINTYTWRFPASPYAQHFRNEVAALLVKMADPNKISELRHIAYIMKRLPQPEADNAMLRLANGYLLNGHIKAADMVVAELSSTSDELVKLEAGTIAKLARMSVQIPPEPAGIAPSVRNNSNVAILQRLALAVAKYQHTALRADPRVGIDTRQVENWAEASEELRAMVKIVSERLEITSVILRTD